jgi:glycyl-tRNA synthetase beta chain
MELLLEIRTEELPASHVRSALEQLDAKFRAELKSAGIAVRELATCGTCRRLVVTADLAAGQEDAGVVVTGPPKAAALLPDGSYSPAALGFAKARGIPVAALEIVVTPRGEYLGTRTVRKGKSAADILAGAVPGIIASLSFPRTMRWRESPFKFSRPIKGLLALFDGKVLPVAFEGLAASDATFGHPIFAPDIISVSGTADYRDKMRQALVIVDFEERKKAILSQIEEKLAPLKARIYPDDELLDRLAYNVEFPLVFQGAFPERYLELPIEVLATAMREGQKLFSVVRDRKQIPVFLGVADVPGDPRELIRAGNERVLKARLEDARFFWEQDIRRPLAERAAGLKNVVYQEKLGTYEDKVQRMKKIVGYLCDRTDSAKVKKEAVDAAALCKADLLTDMVREFPSLQGKMGGLYAKAEGYPAAVYQAVYEHYLPASLEDEPPSSMTGALVSVADKMDSIVGAFGVGVQASGSSDPFGLRRNAHGVCAIIIEKKLDISFVNLLDKVLSVVGDKLLEPKAEVKAACLEFFEGRLRYIFEKQGFRYDLVEAALGPGIDRIAHAFRRVKALDGLRSSPDFEPFILMAKRINNILKDAPACRLNPDLFVEKEERELHSNLVIIRDNAGPMIEKGDFARAQSIILRLRPSLNAFFDKVLVMAEDKKVRQNRLGLLQAIRKLLLEIADYSRVVVEGERPGKPGNSR